MSSWAVCCDDLLAGGGTMSIGPLTCLVTARDRVEVGPPVRGEGRLVDCGIKVQALGRGARSPVVRRDCAVASDRFRSRAPVGGEMDRVTQRLHIDRVVLLVNAGHRMCCRRYGHDHRDHQGA